MIVHIVIKPCAFQFQYGTIISYSFTCFATLNGWHHFNSNMVRLKGIFSPQWSHCMYLKFQFQYGTIKRGLQQM